MSLPISAATATGSSVIKGLMSTVLNAASSSMSINSLADLARPCRVEPIAIIDNVLADQPYMQDLMKVATSQFAAYYLQAVNMVMGVGKIDTLKVFDSLNPVRSVAGDIAGTVFSKEQYVDGLPSIESFQQKVDRTEIAEYSFEAYTYGMEAAEKEEAKKTAKGLSSSDTGKIYEVENLAVGKLLNVEIDGKDGAKAKLPVLIRLVPAVVPSEALTHIFVAGGRDSWSHRFFLVKTGQLHFWRDFILGQDMIDAHMKALMTDRSGVYKEITDRRRNNVSKAVTSGRVSLADASNIAIISSNTLKTTAAQLYSRIDDLAVREKIFDNSYLLMLLVVDERWNTVTIYHRGVDLTSKYRLDDIKMAEKNKGSDITELFKMFSKQMSTNI
ncbi:virion structural protein [Pseudomonas phage Phabio]|uniref:Virion structural protein n=1 Tax=Pseudomonas phage Phabio TaxID=2006668 RepID=A0A1Y0SYN4_9CAUD|nr:virion structural protein [Pseudomonas phage Phabio]ARV76766.1 virion structural protein [Pseudomonas phage Phabio]